MPVESITGLIFLVTIYTFLNDSNWETVVFKETSKVDSTQRKSSGFWIRTKGQDTKTSFFVVFFVFFLIIGKQQDKKIGLVWSPALVFSK